MGLFSKKKDKEAPTKVYGRGSPIPGGNLPPSMSSGDGSAAKLNAAGTASLTTPGAFSATGSSLPSSQQVSVQEVPIFSFY